MSDDLPPEPAQREITPAPEDFENPPPFVNLGWPVFWIGAIVVLASVAYCIGWVEPIGH